MRLIFFSFLAVCSIQLRAQQKNNYYPSGLLQYSYDLKDDLLNGSFISYYDNGAVRAKGAFKNGQKSGVWQAWDTLGMLRSKRYYRNNTDFDLLSEWASTGCNVSSDYLERKKKALQQPFGFHDDYLFLHRYWEIISSEPANHDLFSDEFNKLLKTEIEAGRIVAFNEDRFFTPIPSTDAAVIVDKIPDEYLLKEEHFYSASNQRMEVRNIGLGLVYKCAAGDKIAWLYVPDIYSVLYKLPLTGPSIADRLRNRSFSTKLDMTTFQSINQKPRKVRETERIAVILAEIDFETGAWVYLLDKDLNAAGK